MKKITKATNMAIIGNTILFIVKIIAGVMYNSIALISDGFNSLSDIITSLIVHISVKVSHQEPDEDHQYGHTRAQPIAALIVAIFTGIVGFELVIASITRLIDGKQIVLGLTPLVVLLGVIFIKSALLVYTRFVLKQNKSQALRAIAVDHRNDILISTTVLIGIILANMGYKIFDPIVAVVIGFYIIKAGYDLAMENLKFLMGEAPDESVFTKIKQVASDTPDVKKVEDIKAHLIGTVVQCEITICVNKNLKITKAHDIGKKVRVNVEKIPIVEKANIHINPF